MGYMSGGLRSKMIAHAMARRHTGQWKRILYALLYGAEVRDIRRMLGR